MPMPSPRRKESETSALGWGANGSPLIRMPLINFWGIHWSWRRANAVNSAIGRVRPQGSTRRPSANGCVFLGRTLPEAWRGDGCGLCALAWPPCHRFGWRCCSATFSPTTIILTSPYQSASLSTPSWPRWVSMWPSWSQTLYINLQGSHLLDTQWTQRSPIGHWGFWLWSRAFANSMGCRSLLPTLSSPPSIGPS